MSLAAYTREPWPLASVPSAYSVCTSARGRTNLLCKFGRMGERLNPGASKAPRPQGLAGSNPAPSAILLRPLTSKNNGRASQKSARSRPPPKAERRIRHEPLTKISCSIETYKIGRASSAATTVGYGAWERSRKACFANLIV